MTIAVRSGGDRRPVTVAEVNLKFIWDVVSRIKIGDKGKAYVVDADGYLMADPDIGLVLRKTRPGRAAAGQGGARRPRRATSRRSLSHDLAGTRVLASVAPIDRWAGRSSSSSRCPRSYRAAERVDPARPAALLLAGLAAVGAGAPLRWRAAWCGRSARWHDGARAHRRRRARPAHRSQDRRRARRPGRAVQPHERRAERVVRRARAQGRAAHRRADASRSTTRPRSARCCASSASRRPTWRRCSRRSWTARRACSAAPSRRCSATTAAS